MEPIKEPIAGLCFNIDNEWWNGHGPDSPCQYCRDSK